LAPHPLIETLVLGVAAAAALAQVPAAQAQSRLFHDSEDQDDDTVADVTRVKVTYRNNIVVRASYHGTALSDLTRIVVYYDTPIGNEGPEYRGRLQPNSDASSFVRISGFNDPTGKAVACRRFGGYANQFTDEPIVVRAPSGCMGGPDKVRVTLQVRQLWATRVFTEWAPARRTFFDTVDRY
jgi:hypothetical protein